MKSLIGKKQNMSQVFDEQGIVYPVTIVKVEPAEEALRRLADFAEGDAVTVSGTSKGRGFQGVVKRHGFHGGSRTHGQKHSEREPGAIGGGGGRAGGRVAKGIRMAGRQGNDRVTIKNLKVIKVDAEGGQIMISGAIPGRRGSKIEIKK